MPCRQPIRRDWGSPPRVRGKPAVSMTKRKRTRITPARAGKTKPRRHNCRPAGDHPRACGENAVKNIGQKIKNGSPPRVRGKRYDVICLPEVPGITPARAGKTTMFNQSSGETRDHPRACGENQIPSAEKRDHKGSPPRVRGKRFCRSSALLYMRITPARAGKTFALSVSTLYSTDHPRACGENFIKHAQKGR